MKKTFQSSTSLLENKTDHQEVNIEDKSTFTEENYHHFHIHQQHPQQQADTITVYKITRFYKKEDFAVNKSTEPASSEEYNN